MLGDDDALRAFVYDRDAHSAVAHKEVAQHHEEQDDGVGDEVATLCEREGLTETLRSQRGRGLTLARRGRLSRGRLGHSTGIGHPRSRRARGFCESGGGSVNFP